MCGQVLSHAALPLLPLGHWASPVRHTATTSRTSSPTALAIPRLLRTPPPSPASEWFNLRTDLLELAAPAPVVQKLRAAQCAMRAYSIFHQF